MRDAELRTCKSMYRRYICYYNGIKPNRASDMSPDNSFASN